MLSNKQQTVNNECHIKIAACRELYMSGKTALQIESAMRDLGWTDFSCRILYSRKKGRGKRDGWIKEFGWRKHEVPSWTGGVAAASADGVVDRRRQVQDDPINATCASSVDIDNPEHINHPVSSQKTRTATPPVQEGNSRKPPHSAGVEDFVAWLERTSPNMTWTWKYQQLLYDALERIRMGESKRLMINIPPRHGKTELLARFVAKSLLDKPAMNVIVASYGQNLANRISRKVRQAICDDAAAKKLPPWTGGVAAASADGVVDRLRLVQDEPEYATYGSSAEMENPQHINHPVSSQKTRTATPPVQEGSTRDFPRLENESLSRPTGFRCAACRAAAAAARDERRDTVRLDHNGRVRCAPAETVNIDECSKCGGPLETELPSWTGGVAAASADRVVDGPRLVEDEPTDATCASSVEIDNPQSINHPVSSQKTRTATPPVQEGSKQVERWNIAEHDRGDVKMFPFTSSKPINTISEWGTAAGGGLKAVGVGAGVTGFGADLIVIDDPVKNRAQAESETYRERVWDWYTDDLYTRLEPEGSIILIQTRWHEDDLAGRLIKQEEDGGEKWEVLSLPALRELEGVAEFGSVEGVAKLGRASERRATMESVPGTVVTGAFEDGASRTPDETHYSPQTSLKGTKIIAQGKAEGRDPGLEADKISDPEGVEQRVPNIARLQAAEDRAALPGGPLEDSLHPGLLSSSPSPTYKPRVIGYPRLYSKLPPENPLPSWTGGVAAASADGVVDRPRLVQDEPKDATCASSVEIDNPQHINHPVSSQKTRTATPPVQEGNLHDPNSQTPKKSETPQTPQTSQTPNPKDWRVVGEALCPERFDVPKLAEIKDQLGSYSFSALYQQRPTPAEGAIFKRAWLKDIVERAPAGLKWFRGYDLAISTKTSADYTASVRVALDEMGIMYIADGFRKRLEYPEQRRFIFEKIMTERDTQHGIEDSGHAKAIMHELRRQKILMRWPFRLIKVTTDKTTRAITWSPRAEEGKLKLVRGAWIDEFVEELIRFPKGKHDDQVDAVSVAVAMMSGGEDKRLFRF